MSKLYTTILLFYTFIFSSLANFITSKLTSDKCRILTLEAGGDKGAYQAGVIKSFIENLPNSDIQWDVISGVSAGSLNGLGMAIFPKGEEKQASDFINKVWLDIKGRDDILAEKINIPLIGKIIGPLYGAFYGESIYDSTPLKNLLTKIMVGRKAERSYLIGATSIRTGKYYRFQNLTTELLVPAVLASSAVPGIFPPVHYQNETFVDGGVSYLMDLTGAIEICIQKGFPQEQIVLDLILTDDGEIDNLSSNFKTFDMIAQTFNILVKNYKFRDLLDALVNYPNVIFRYMVAPSEKISTSIPLNFDPADIRHSIQIGEKDGKNVIDAGEGVEFRKMMREYKEEVKRKVRSIEGMKMK